MKGQDEIFDVFSEVTYYTLDIICECGAMGINVGAQNNPGSLYDQALNQCFRHYPAENYISLSLE